MSMKRPEGPGPAGDEAPALSRSTGPASPLHAEAFEDDGFRIEVEVREEAAGGYSGTVTVTRPLGNGETELVFSNGRIVHKSRFPSPEAAREHAVEVGRYAVYMCRLG